MTNFEYDRAIYAEGFKTVCGIDEAGRGPLAGPVYAAAVILDPCKEIPGIDDSKKLSAKKREILFKSIQQQAVAFSVASASVEEIESMNILQATFLAMQRAVKGLEITPELVIVDGNQKPPFSISMRTIVSGDALSASIAAASILAKVSRDHLMLELDKKYPCYLFGKHKGYGTELHIELIKKYGPSPIHRRSFLKKILST